MNTAQCHDKTLLYLSLKLDLRAEQGAVWEMGQLAHTEGNTGGAVMKVTLLGFDQLKLDAT